MSAATGHSPRVGRGVLVTTSISGFLIFGSASGLTVAVPSMAAELPGGAVAASWMLLAFLLTNSSTIIVFGKLSDALGRRWFYLGGLIAFTACSVVCCLAHDDAVLIVARCVQGLSAASAVSNSTAVISDVFDRERLAFALGLNVTAGGVSALLGPVLSGLLVGLGGWRAIFAATVPLGLLAIATGWRSLAHVHAPVRSRLRFDVGGALLSVLGIAALLFVGQRAGGGGSWAVTAAILAAGAAALVAFAFVERRSGNPLLDLAIVSGPRATVYLSSFFTAFSFGAVLALVVLFLELVQGFSAAAAGAFAIPMGGALVAVAPLAGLLGRRFSARVLSALGSAVLSAAMLLIAVLMATDAPAVWLVVALTVIGAGEGLFMSAVTLRVVDGVSPDRRAIANGFRSVMHNGAMTLSTAIVLAAVTAGAGSAAAGAAGAGAHEGSGVFALLAGCLGAVGVLGAVAAAVRRPGVVCADDAAVPLAADRAAG